jgi:hypothetical protein
VFKKKVKKMKNKYMKIQILAIVILLLGTLSVSGEKNPDEVCIKLNLKQGPWEILDPETLGEGINDGRWHANGAFVDGGLVHDDYQMLPDPDDPYTQGMRSYYTMTGRNGKLHIKVELESFEWIGPSTIMFVGEWETDGGTDAYIGVTGGGKATQIIVLAAAMNSGVFGEGGPARAVHVVLEGDFQIPS